MGWGWQGDVIGSDGGAGIWVTREGRRGKRRVREDMTRGTYLTAVYPALFLVILLFVVPLSGRLPICHPRHSHPYRRRPRRHRRHWRQPPLENSQPRQCSPPSAASLSSSSSSLLGSFILESRSEPPESCSPLNGSIPCLVRCVGNGGRLYRIHLVSPLLPAR